MTAPTIGSSALYLGLAAVIGVVIPWVVMKMAIRALDDSPAAQTTNYRGRAVSYGLGVVWLVWAVGASLASVALSAVSATLPVLSLVPLAFLATAAFGFGLFDDAYGTSAAKGFRGHVRALSRGVLTTGGLKLIGISVAALAFTAIGLSRAPWALAFDSALGEWWYWPARAVMFLLAAASVALCGNVLNLMDLRPGRAAKSYSVLVFVGLILSVASAFTGGTAAATSGDTLSVLITLLGNSVWLAGPVLAVVGLDLAERGMLGDAGANPMGVLAGAYVVSSLGPIGVPIFFVLVLALNVASEKVSFSRVIESNAALSWADNLGRLTDGSANIETRRTP